VKYLLTILFLLTAYAVNAQYIINSSAYQYKGLKQVNSLQPPTGTTFPVTSVNAPDSNYAAWYYNKTDTAFYQWNPIPHTWTKLQSNGGITVSIDSIFITSIDSLFITNTDSIFIISGNDTIFIGNGNPAMDTAYQRGDSLFGVKSGVEFLIGLTGAAAPSGGMDTAYTRNDSIFGTKNNSEFLISNIHQLIDSIFITNTDSIFIISGNDTIFVGTNGSGGDSIVSFTKNNTLDSIILLLRDGRRLAVKDESGGPGGSTITLDSVIVSFDGLQRTKAIDISASGAKNIDISSEAEGASGFNFAWNETQAVLKYQAAIQGTYKFYITYYR